jgi:hypothetical protein
MRLFHRRGNAVKKWHNRAMVIDFKKTRLTILDTQEGKISDWVYEKYGENQDN